MGNQQHLKQTHIAPRVISFLQYREGPKSTALGLMTFISHQFLCVVFGDLHKSGKQLGSIFLSDLPIDGLVDLLWFFHVHIFPLRHSLHGFLEVPWSLHSSRRRIPVSVPIFCSSSNSRRALGNDLGLVCAASSIIRGNWPCCKPSVAHFRIDLLLYHADLYGKFARAKH